MMHGCAVFLLCLALGSAERGEQRSHERHALQLTSDGHLVGQKHQGAKDNNDCNGPDLPCSSSPGPGPSPTPPTPPECFNLGLNIEPDLAGSSRSVAGTPEACLERCRKTAGCVYYVRWSDGGCHLKGSDATVVPNNEDTEENFSGPKDCQACAKPMTKYEPDLAGSKRTIEWNQMECKKRCKKTTGCVYYTYWSDGGCHLADASAKNKKVQEASVSGPARCPDDGDDGVATTTTTDGEPAPSPTPPVHGPTPSPTPPVHQPTPVPAPSGKTCDEVANNKACAPSGFCRTCRERYSWLTTQQLSEDMAKDAIAKEFPQECGACATGVLSKTVPEQKGTDGAFICGKGYRSFQWTRRLSDDIKNTILKPLNYQWPNPFGLSADDVHNWVNNDLLASNPFGDKGVLIPWPKDDDDLLGHGGWVGYSRRQVCYITAQFILGADVKGYPGNGLHKLMAHTYHKCHGTGDFRYSWAFFLASCAADPGLKNGGQGPLILVAKGKDTPPVEDAREIAKTAKMDGAGLRVCNYDTGIQNPSSLPKVPTEGCSPIKSHAVGKDFMTGGLPGQVTQDISAQWFGGYLFDAGACGLGGGQDERLSVYFPEVTILAYFLSDDRHPQLRQPAWFLGTRSYFKNLDGTARFDHKKQLAELPFDNDLVEVELAGSTFKISSSRPVTVFMSENQGLCGHDSEIKVRARQNKDRRQRATDGKFAFANQVRAWYRSTALTSYHHEIHPAMKKLVKTIGSGPWGAGLWWGDSQVGFLASWLGQAIAATTWGQPFGLDQYIYSSFTENPGNQCLLHSSESCRACMGKCYMPRGPHWSSYWMTEQCLYNRGPCMNDAESCGNVGIEKVVADYGSGTAEKLWNDIESKLSRDVSHTVFELISG